MTDNSPVKRIKLGNVRVRLEQSPTKRLRKLASLLLVFVLYCIYAVHRLKNSRKSNVQRALQVVSGDKNLPH